MKKLLSLLVVMFMAIALVGCDIVKETSITVKYETNGGSEIADSEIKLDNIATFKLPEDPTKEGFVFGGWFIDEAFANEFESIDITTGTLTLYAKWDEEGNQNLPPVPKITGEGIDATLKLTANIEGGFTAENLEDKEVANISYKSGVDLDLEVRVVIKDLSIEALNDLEAMLSVSLTYAPVTDDETTVITPTVVTGQIYIKEGYAYINIPLVQITGKVELAKIVESLKGAYDTKVEDGTIPEAGIGELISEIPAMILEKMEEFNISSELIAKAIEVIKLLIPTLTKTDVEYKYEITQTQLDSFFDAFKKFFLENGNEIYEIINTIKEKQESSEDEEKEPVFIDGVGTFGYGEAFYTDTENVVHQFKDCYEELINTYHLLYEFENIGVVLVYPTYEHFDSKTWAKITYDEFVERGRAIDIVLDSGETLKHGENGWYDKDNTFHKFSEDTDGKYGYINENGYYYCHYTLDAFDATTWKLLTKEELYKINIDNLIEEVGEIIGTVKDSITINDCKIVYTMNEDGSPAKLQLVVDIDSENVHEYEYSKETQYTSVDIDCTLSFATFSPTITFPEFDETYFDMTEMVVSVLDSLVEKLSSISINDILNSYYK